MNDFSNSTWSEANESNDYQAPLGYPPGMLPSGMHATGRAHMGASKRSWNRSNASQTSGGTSAAYTLTYDVAPGTYVKGEVFRFFAHVTNTGTATMNINTMGARPIVRFDGQPLAANDIRAGSIVTLAYDGANFRMTSAIPSSLALTGGLTVGGNATVTGALAVAGAITQAGHAVWHAGNIAPVSKAGDTMTGRLTFAAGLDFGLNAVTSATDFSKHISLYGGHYGLSVTSGTLNIVSSMGNGIVDARGTLRQNGVDVLTRSSGVIKSGDTMTGDLMVAKANPKVTLRDYSATGDRSVHNAGGEIRFSRNDGQTTFAIRDDGSLWSSQMGDLNARIEQRGSDWGEFHAAWRVAKSGDTMTGKLTAQGGITMANAVASSVTDLTSHLSIYSNTYGLNVTSSTLNLVANSGNGIIDARGTLRQNGIDVLTRGGGVVTGVLEIQRAPPALVMHYPGVRIWEAPILRADGSLDFYDRSAGRVVLKLGANGDILFNTPGAETWFSTLRHYALRGEEARLLVDQKFDNTRLTGSFWSGGSASYDAPSGGVITGYSRTSGSNGQVSSIRGKYIQNYSPSRGWVGAYNEG